MRERTSDGQIGSEQMKLGEILVARSLITRHELQSALEQQKTSSYAGLVRFKVRGNSRGEGHATLSEARPTGPRHILKLEPRRGPHSSGFGGDKLQRWISTRIANYQLPQAQLTRGRTSEVPGLVERRGSLRVALHRSQKLYFRLCGGSVEGVMSDLGEGGMFVHCVKPHRAGTKVDFELRFADEFAFVEGVCQVAWVANGDSERPHESGMGLRFLDLHGQGREVVRLAVQQRCSVRH